jgi:hypothetical protein
MEPVEWQGRASDEIHELARQRGQELAREVKKLCGGE